MSESRLFLGYQALLGLPVALCLLGLATAEGGIARLFARSSFAASFSYTLYVVHVPVMTLVFSLRAHLALAPGLAGTVATLLAALVTAEIVSYAAALVVERPRFFRKVLFRLLTATGVARPALAPSA